MSTALTLPPDHAARLADLKLVQRIAAQIGRQIADRSRPFHTIAVTK